MKHKISKVLGRMVFDSRGIPTVEAEIISNSGLIARAIAPAGSSKGKKEAYEKRDKGRYFNGLSVFKNVNIINKDINKLLNGINLEDQDKIDKLLIDLDGTKNKKKLGANTTIAVSMCALKLAAICNKKSLWDYINEYNNQLLPLPQIQIIGGGSHAKGSLSLQDFLIIPNGAESFSIALEWVFKIYMLAGEELSKKNMLYGVADEGGYWPSFSKNEDALDFLTNTIEKAGFKPFKQISIAIDAASNNFKFGTSYKLDNKMDITGRDLLSIYTSWLQKYPIISLEDPFSENDFLLFSELKNKSPSYLQLVGDDLVVTNAQIIKKAKKYDAINTVLIKPNQVGTISETKKAVDVSSSLDLMSILSARSGETEDTTISDLSVGWGIKQLKVGSFTRSERLAKWNQCLRIGEKLKNNYQMHNNYKLNWHDL